MPIRRQGVVAERNGPQRIAGLVGLAVEAARSLSGCACLVVVGDDAVEVVGYLDGVAAVAAAGEEPLQERVDRLC